MGTGAKRRRADQQVSETATTDKLFRQLLLCVCARRLSGRTSISIIGQESVETDDGHAIIIPNI